MSDTPGTNWTGMAIFFGVVIIGGIVAYKMVMNDFGPRSVPSPQGGGQQTVPQQTVPPPTGGRAIGPAGRIYLTVPPTNPRLRALYDRCKDVEKGRPATELNLQGQEVIGCV